MINEENIYPEPLVKPLYYLMKIINFMVITSGIIMAITFFLVVILRYGFGADLFAYEEWLMVIAFWMFFLGGAIATHERKHINADIFGFLINNKKLAFIRALVIDLIEFIIILFVVYWGYLMVQESIRAYPNWQQTVALNIPFLIPRMGIFIGFSLMALYTALHLYTLISRSAMYLKSTNKN